MTHQIGITARRAVDGATGEVRDAVDRDWWTFLNAALPEWQVVVVPSHVDLATRAAGDLDALILSGGDDLGADPDRDAAERTLIEHATTHAIPVLGVCRGMQHLWVAAGGKLADAPDGHVATRHDVTFADDTPAREVNSFHDNALAPDAVPTGWNIWATAADGTVEAIRHQELPHVGIMWHPERETAADPADVALLQGFVRR